MGYSRFFLLLFLLFFEFQAFSQIVFKHFPDYKIRIDSAFFDINSRRNIVPLNGEWAVFTGNDRANAKKIAVPSTFSGEGELIFERSFNFNREQISDNKMEIHFLGLNYTADISVNDNIIYRHPGGEYPFRFDLPKDILLHDRNNVISVKLNYHLDSETTIPVKQRFMFPHNYGGILKDVYIKLLPNISIADIDINYTITERNNASFRITTKIDNKEFRKNADTILVNNNFSFRVRFTAPNGQQINLSDYNFTLPVNSDQEISQSAEISSPLLWSPSSPLYYRINFELWRGNDLIDITSRRVAVYSLNAGTDSLMFNNRSFILNGVTYIPSFYDYGSLYSYQQMERDISIIKEAGFNAVRFAKSIPHPYLLYQCEQFGLLAFIELPVNAIPSGLADDINFMNRSKGFMGSMLRAFKDYSIIAAVGVGSSFLPELDGHITYINELTSFLKGRQKRTYASFAGFNGLRELAGLDFYGLELFNTPVTSVAEELAELQLQLGSGRVIISSATYVVNAGNTNGYVNEHSFEAQAKYFEDLIDYAHKTDLPGYFINSMFDYRGDFPSLVSGHSAENIYRIGILGENRATDRLGYKIVSAKLHNTEIPTIPIGSKKDSSPMVFVLFGLAIALLVGVLINSGRKFREDASRALLRPYNFYADVRDQRIMSGFQASLLAIIISTVSALLIGNLLFYFRQEIRFEKLLLAFGSKNLMDTVSYLAWNPGIALVWLTIGSLAALIIITLLVKMASFFVRNRVFLSGIYYVVVWSFLPLVLLVPVGIILFRILDAEYTNLYIYLGLLLFTLWILYRLMKGIYVIFDVNPGGVYFYSFVFILIVLGGVIIYYEVQSSVLSYLSLTIKQYNIFG
jgi:beta-galactosidase